MAKKAKRAAATRKNAARTTTRRTGTASRGTKRSPARTRAKPGRADTLLADMAGADRRQVGHVRLDIVRTGDARVKREVYPPGFRWSKDMKPVTGTELCMHAHVGFLARGEIHIEYADGCVVEFKAPQAVAIEPGHDGWVVGREAAVLIEFDFERDTVRRLGMPDRHGH